LPGAAAALSRKPGDIKEAGLPPVNAMSAGGCAIGRIPPLSIAK
jgi:hypothetical protein